MELCRYESFERFCEMLLFKELTLVSPEKWNDKYENYILQVINNKDSCDDLYKELQKRENISSGNIDRVIDFAKRLCLDARCICFSMSVDSEVMWNAYNYNNETIMWKTTEYKIEKINRHFQLGIVQYDLEEIGFRNFVDLLSVYDGRACVKNPIELFIHKRSAFTYEQELRVIDISNRRGKDTLVQPYPIPSLKGLIDGIMVHPLATRRFTLMVEKMGEHFDIPFLGQSKIYQIDKLF